MTHGVRAALLSLAAAAAAAPASRGQQAAPAHLLAIRAGALLDPRGPHPGRRAGDRPVGVHGPSR